MRISTDRDENYSLDNFIREEMERRRMSARNFADFIDVSHGTIDRVLNGKINKPSLDFLEKLSAKTKTDLESLVTLASPELAQLNRISPKARILAQRIDQLPPAKQDLLHATILGHYLMNSDDDGKD